MGKGGKEEIEEAMTLVGYSVSTEDEDYLIKRRQLQRRNRVVRVKTVTNGRTEYRDVDLNDLIKYRDDYK